MKYRKKLSEVDAFQWKGDHPAVENFSEAFGSKRECELCNKMINTHGRIAGLEYDVTVCPYDWIVSDGVHMSLCKPDKFEELYEAIEEAE